MLAAGANIRHRDKVSKTIFFPLYNKNTENKYVNIIIRSAWGKRTKGNSEDQNSRVPTGVQWVKNPTAAAWVTVEVQVQSLAWGSGFRIWCCHRCGVDHSGGLNLIPGPGSSTCHRCREKKKKNQKFHPNCTNLCVFFSGNCKTWLCSSLGISIQLLSPKVPDGERFLSQKTQNTSLSLSLSRLSVFYFLSSKFWDSKAPSSPLSRV